MKRLASIAGCAAMFSASAVWASSYSDAVLALTPNAYYQLNDTTGDGIDSAGTHPFSAAYVEPAITRGVPGPRASDGFVGMGTENLSWDFPKNSPWATGPSAGARTEDYIPVTGSAARTVIAWFRLTQRPGREGNPDGLNTEDCRQADIGFLQYGRPQSGSSLYQEFRFGASVEVDALGARTDRDLFSLNLGARAVRATDTALAQETWYMGAVVFPEGLATAADIRIFLNGTLQTLVGDTGVVPNTANNPVPVSFRIGRDFGGYGVGGEVDEVAVWHRALTDDEIIGLYNVAAGVVAAPEWNVDADGNWTDSANWSGSVPNAAGAKAVFGSKITAPRTVTLDAAQTVGEIRFENTNRYTVAGANVLTVSKPGGASINVVSGSHTISAPLALATDVGIAVAQAADTLTLSGEMTAAASITKSGPGALELKHARAAGLTISGGGVTILAGAAANETSRVSVVTSLDIAGGPITPTAKLDLTNNSMVIDYTGASPIEGVRQLLSAGASSGQGLVSSASTPAGTRLGYGEASTLGLSSFGGQTVDATSVLIKFTYGGDTNLDGQVDITDLGNLATAWQSSAGWTAGDSDYSGFVDITDLGILATNWQQGVGSPLGPSFQEAMAMLGLAGGAVPEPAASAMIAGAAWCLLRRRVR